MTLSHHTLHYYLSDQGAMLSTRPRGREAADQLRRLADEPGDLIIDFSRVEVASAPFLQELIDGIQTIILTAGDAGRLTLLANMNDDVYETMGYVLSRKKLTVPYQRGNEIDLLEATPQLAETLREAQRLVSFTAPDLAKQLKIEPSAATQRLKKLLLMGAVVREEDSTAQRGKRHLYRPVTPFADASERETKTQAIART